MSLRLRLLLMIGISLSLLWAVVALWMLCSLGDEVNHTLDQRLAMSAQMVSGLISQNPNAWQNQKDIQGLSNRAERVLSNGFDCQISSMRGEVIARTPGAELEAVSGSVLGYSERNIKDERWRSYTLEANGLRVTTADRIVERQALLQNVTMAAFVPFIVALSGSLIVLWFGVRNGLLPLERIRQALADRTLEMLAPLSVTNISHDLLPLVNTLNQLFVRIDATSSRERRFTSDAAHELRTPLTAIKTHLQVARITEEQDTQQALDYAEEGVARLQSTLTQLLTLSQIEGPFSWDDGHTATAERIAHLAMDDAALDTIKSNVRFQTDGSEYQLALPEALAVTALRNLLDNALRYASSPQGVSLELKCTKDTCTFYIRDNGPGLSDEELGLATQRFWRQNSGRGSGLGLSIVEAITQRYGGELKLKRRLEGGIEAILSLPIIVKNSEQL
ncbi:MAG: hypothetical protein K0R08_1123 [Solimicrobium sp.]|nr:hypothetical protein [Solimicrobium sp.]